MIPLTPDELTAMARSLSDKQRKCLAGFADGKLRMFIHFQTGEALRIRGYLIRMSTLLTKAVWASSERVREYDYRGRWRHEWDTNSRGLELAQWLAAQPPPLA